MRYLKFGKGVIFLNVYFGDVFLGSVYRVEFGVFIFLYYVSM